MKHLIVYSNPDDKSFSNEIKEFIKSYSLERGHEVEVRDLYRIAFNPVLKLEELESLSKGVTLPDVRREQEYLEWADVITFVYPIWWEIPAMMKGYFDRVFAYDYAYTYTTDGPKGLLPPKKVFRLNPMGTPREVYEKNGLRKTYENAIDKGIIESTGMRVVKSKLFGSSPREDKGLQDKYLGEIKDIISEVLG